MSNFLAIPYNLNLLHNSYGHFWLINLIFYSLHQTTNIFLHQNYYKLV